MSKEILVAGGTGLVGANLTLKLKELGLNVISTRYQNRNSAFKECVKYDLSQFEQCLAATKNKSAVAFCASIVAGVKFHKENPTGVILPSLKINAGLLEACARNKVKKIILISSTTVYQPADYSIREDECDLNIPPFDAYFGVGWYNRYLENLASLYSKIYGMEIVVFRPTNIYGKFDNFDNDRSHVVPSLIKRALKKEDPFEVWGSPGIVRDFIYVEDFVEDIIFALSHKEVPLDSPINICNGSPITIREAVETILKVCNHSPKVFFNIDKPTSIPYRAVDNTKYSHFFGKKERTNFENGIKNTVNWYKSFKN